MDPFQVADQLGGDAASGLADRVTGTHLGEQRFGLSSGEVLLRAARDQFQQQLVELGDHPGVVLTQRASPVDQDPQYCELFVVDHRA